MRAAPRTTGEEERNVGAQRHRHFDQTRATDPAPQHARQNPKYGRSIATAATEPRPGGDVLVDLDHHIRPASEFPQHEIGRARRQVPLSPRHVRRTADPTAHAGTASPGSNRHLIVKRNRNHQAFEQVVPVGTPPDDSKRKIHLCRRTHPGRRRQASHAESLTPGRRRDNYPPSVLTLTVTLELDTAGQLAVEAGRLIAESLGRATCVDRKSAVDLVTEVDRHAESIIKQGLAEAFPNIPIVAEESSANERPEGRYWCVDPLDGTTNFVHGLPHCAVSIALLDEDGPCAAVVHDPCKQETFAATREGPATLNDSPIGVSAAERLDEALLVTGFPYDRRAHIDFYLTYFRLFLVHARDVRRLGSAALDLCYVAAGRFDGFWEWGLHPWDTAAGWLIVERAGGRVTGFSGARFDPWRPQVLATNGLIHDAALAVLADASGSREGSA